MTWGSRGVYFPGMSKKRKKGRLRKPGMDLLRETLGYDCGEPEGAVILRAVAQLQAYRMREEILLASARIGFNG